MMSMAVMTLCALLRGDGQERVIDRELLARAARDNAAGAKADAGTAHASQQDTIGDLVGGGEPRNRGSDGVTRPPIAAVNPDQGSSGRAAADSSGDLNRAEAQARVDLSMAEVRLEVIQARKALAARKFDDAAAAAQKALDAIARLPGDVDASVYELQAEGVLAKAARSGAAVAARRPAGPALPRTPPRPTDPQVTAGARATRAHGGESTAVGSVTPAQDEVVVREKTATAVEVELEEPADAPNPAPDRTYAKARAAAKLARNYEGADTADVDTRGDADVLRERALENQTPHECHGYRPAEEIIDVNGILERDQQRYFYERSLRLAYKVNEAERLLHADEIRVAPDGDVAYPDDWPEKTAKRARYRDGTIAKSPSWVDRDGREWYMAIYDIHDIIYEPPDFFPQYMIDPAAEKNMEALRLRSEIFSGYPEDLAAGIPLLRYFGASSGLDPFELRGPKYSLDRQRQVVDMIRRFTAAGGSTDPAILTDPPATPPAEQPR